MDSLSPDEFQSFLDTSPLDWSIFDTGEISTHLSTQNFNHSMALAHSIASIADKQNHHPDLLVKYKSLTVTIMTHDVGALTEKDIRFATAVNELIKESL